MKFLCVDCNNAMTLSETKGPHEGSFSVVFACPSCGRQIAMLTNSMETQMVRSLGVKIGGRDVPAEPMEMVRNSLARGGGKDTAERTASHYAAMAPNNDTTSADDGTGSKCPFTGVIADAFARQTEEIVWTRKAEERIARIPEFAQPMVRKGVEMHAIENGHTEITEALIDEVKVRFGM